MRYAANRWIVHLVIALSVGLGVVSASNAQSLIWLGPGEAFDVSDDGRTVVGRDYNRRPVVWDPRTNQTIVVSNSEGYLHAVSADGSRAVGVADRKAILWIPNRGAIFLDPVPSADYTIGEDITPDGSIAVGIHNFPEDTRIVLWHLTSNPLTYQIFASLAYHGAYGISDNARTIVGFIFPYPHSGVVLHLDSQGNPTQSIVLQPLLGHSGAGARDVSRDGTVVVGSSGTSSYNPVMWRASNSWQPEPLAGLGGSGTSFENECYDVKNATIVGGSSHPSGRYHACRWNVATATTQVEDLNVTYSGLLSNNDYLMFASAISRDDRYIVGWGYNAATGRREAFLLDTWRTGDTNGDGCVDDSDLLAVLFAFGTPGTGYTRHEDINKDGIVDDADLLQVLFNFGSGC